MGSTGGRPSLDACSFAEDTICTDHPAHCEGPPGRHVCPNGRIPISTGIIVSTTTSSSRGGLVSYLARVHVQLVHEPDAASRASNTATR